MWEQSFPVVSDRHPFVRSEVKVVKCVRRHKEVVMMFANWTGVFTTIAISKFVQRHEKRVGEGRGRDSFDDYLEKCLFGALLNLKKKNKKCFFNLWSGVTWFSTAVRTANPAFGTFLPLPPRYFNSIKKIQPGHIKILQQR